MLASGHVSCPPPWQVQWSELVAKRVVEWGKVEWHGSVVEEWDLECGGEEEEDSVDNE